MSAKIHVIVQVPLQPSPLEMALGRDVVDGLNDKGIYFAKLAFGSSDDGDTPVEIPIIGGPVRLIVSTF